LIQLQHRQNRDASDMSDYSNLPDFDALPPVKGMPQGCAWGLFDKNGKKDHLGCLNLLTPEVIKAAYEEAREGVTVSLNWEMNALPKPAFGRVSTVQQPNLDFLRLTVIPS
jgi:hypothetical protein